ncbi:unnamed protein product, partial [Onchocerca flexuosa]|uniref:Secreted protein n=1 Tax=Onchocerca flexuosa TaxID=387005 RepID=A0A183HTA7_9BILA
TKKVEKNEKNEARIRESEENAWKCLIKLTIVICLLSEMDELHTTAPTTTADTRQPFHGWDGWKDWTNRNIFTSSVDETTFIHGYQNQETTDTFANDSVQGK